MPESNRDLARRAVARWRDKQMRRPAAFSDAIPPAQRPPVEPFHLPLTEGDVLTLRRMRIDPWK